MREMSLILLWGLIMGCSTQDFRNNSIYKNTDLVFDTASGNSKGTILLIHGTAPQNIDGQIPIPEINETIPNHYLALPTYKNLSRELNELGWDTVRYTRLGVYQTKVNMDEYSKTDLNNIMNQLKEIWSIIPNNKPKIAFAWSGGSVHLLQLPLQGADGIIILGGIATKRTEVYELSTKNEKELSRLKEYLSKVLSQEGKIERTKMLSNDMSHGRFYDENNLEDNWTYLKEYQKLPTLILHGEEDEDVDISQSKVWGSKLPKNEITTIIGKNRNHIYSTTKSPQDMNELAGTINSWLLKR